MEITPRALLRRRRTLRAAIKANLSVHVSSVTAASGPLTTKRLVAVDADLPDTDIGQAKELGLRVRTTCAGRTKIARPSTQHELGRLYGRLDMRFKEAEQISFEPLPIAQPELAVRRLNDDGRAVVISSLVSRVSQEVVRLTLDGPLDGLLSQTVHGFRPRRNPETALYHARHFMRQGRTFAIEFDIQKFFASTSLELVAETLSERAPFINQGLKNIILFELRPPILDRTTPAEGFVAVPSCLSAGMPLVPLLANLVADTHLDRPLADLLGGPVRMIRYADDCLLLARSESAALEALEACDEALAQIGLRRHPTKGTCGEVVDLRDQRVPYLGYEIGKGDVRLSFDRHEDWVRRIAAAEDDRAGLRLAHGFRRQLIFDPRRRTERSLARLGSRSTGAALLLERALESQARARGRLHAKMAPLVRS